MSEKNRRHLKQNDSRRAFWEHLLNLLKARDLITLQHMLESKLVLADAAVAAARRALGMTTLTTSPDDAAVVVACNHHRKHFSPRGREECRYCPWVSEPPREQTAEEKVLTAKHEKALAQVRWD